MFAPTLSGRKMGNGSQLAPHLRATQFGQLPEPRMWRQLYSKSVPVEVLSNGGQMEVVHSSPRRFCQVRDRDRVGCRA